MQPLSVLTSAIEDVVELMDIETDMAKAKAYGDDQAYEEISAAKAELVKSHPMLSDNSADIVTAVAQHFDAGGYPLSQETQQGLIDGIKQLPDPVTIFADAGSDFADHPFKAVGKYLYQYILPVVMPKSNAIEKASALIKLRDLAKMDDRDVRHRYERRYR